MLSGHRKHLIVSSVILLLLLTFMPAAIPAAAAPDQANIFLIATGDNGQSGPAVGCGDSLVAVTVDIGNPGSTEAKISAALGQLFGIH